MSSSNASHRGVTEYGKDGCERQQTENQQYGLQPPTGTTGSTFADCVSFDVTPLRTAPTETMTLSNDTEHGEDHYMDEDGRSINQSTSSPYEKRTKNANHAREPSSSSGQAPSVTSQSEGARRETSLPNFNPMTNEANKGSPYTTPVPPESEDASETDENRHNLMTSGRRTPLSNWNQEQRKTQSGSETSSSKGRDKEYQHVKIGTSPGIEEDHQAHQADNQ